MPRIRKIKENLDSIAPAPVNFQKVRQTTVVERTEPVIETVIENEPAENLPLPANDLPTARVVITPEPIDDYPDEPVYYDEKTLALQFLDSLPDNTQISVIVNRLPDAFNQKNSFLNPSASKQQIGSFKWNVGQADIAELLTIVQNEFGGGNYNFSIHERGFTPFNWNETLSDSPVFREKFETAARERQLQQSRIDAERAAFASQPAFATAPPAPVDEIDDFVEKAEKYKRLAAILSPPAPVINTGDAARTVQINPNNPIAAALRASETGDKDLAKALLDMAKDQASEKPAVGAVESVLNFAADTLDNPDRLGQIQQLVGSFMMYLLPNGLPVQQPVRRPTARTRPQSNPARDDGDGDGDGDGENYLSKRERDKLAE